MMDLSIFENDDNLGNIRAPSAGPAPYRSPDSYIVGTPDYYRWLNQELDNWGGQAQYPSNGSSSGTGTGTTPVRVLTGGDVGVGGETPPSWMQGTFRGTAPNGTVIDLQITASGSVTAILNGTSFNGNFAGGLLNLNGASSMVTQINGGIVTTRTDNGEAISYARTGGAVNPPRLPPEINPLDPTGTGGSGVVNGGVGVPMGGTPTGTKANPQVGVAPAAGMVNVAGFEIDSTTLLIGGAAVIGALILFGGKGK